MTDPDPSARLERLNRLLALAWERSAFYRAKWRAAGLSPAPLCCLEELARFPFTTRAELVHDQASCPPLGTRSTVPTGDFIRLHSSSGTTRAPLLCADDQPSWQAVVRCSRTLWEWAGVGRADRVFLAMPFGASSGPWIMQAGAHDLGCLCFTVGQASVAEQLEWIARFEPTVLAAKPETLRALAAGAAASGTSPASWGVRTLVCGGSPGGHVARTRRALERSFAAVCCDRYGLTEAGSVAGECTSHSGALHVLESDFIVETRALGPTRSGREHDAGELVLTGLSRTACPLVRYRTGDLVRVERRACCSCGLRGARLVAGVRRVSPRRGSHEPR